MANKAENYINFLNRRWYLNVTRNISVFANAITCAAYIKNYRNFNVLPVEALYITKDGRKSYAFTSIESIEKYKKDLDKFYKQPRLLERLEKTYYRYGKALMAESAKLAKTMTHKNYQSYRRVAERHFTGFQPTNVIGTHFSRLLNDRIKILRPELTQQEIDIYISELTYPGKLTPLTRSQKALLQIGTMLQKEKKFPADISGDKKIKRKLDDYMRRYAFIPVNFIDDPWTEAEVLGQIKKLMDHDCQQELEAILKTDREKKKKSRKLLSKITDKETKNLVRTLQVGTYLNEYRKYIVCHASLAYQPMLKEITKRYDLINWKECFKLTPDEIEKLYFKNDKKILGVLPSRKVAGICFSKNKYGYRLMSEKEITLFRPITDRENSKTNIMSGREIKGVIANKGVVHGTAKIISGKNEFHKFIDGDIIVTAMTSVDFVPLMKRASAYVTNEGGITSHASIVSRELNKPCIVGTKNATEILRDGDLIEVDANRGVVKILKRK